MHNNQKGQEIHYNLAFSFQKMIKNELYLELQMDYMFQYFIIFLWNNFPPEFLQFYIKKKISKNFVWK